MPTRISFTVDTEDHEKKQDIEAKIDLELEGYDFKIEYVSNMSCSKAPLGWICTRSEGHDGPCAAHESFDQDVVYIAECQIHGLHGERNECFVCGGPVKQVALARVSE